MINLYLIDWLIDCMMLSEWVCEVAEGVQGEGDHQAVSQTLQGAELSRGNLDKVCTI